MFFKRFSKALQKVCKRWGAVIFYSNRIVCLLKSYEKDKKQEANFKSRPCFSINYMIAEKNNHASMHASDHASELDNKKTS